LTRRYHGKIKWCTGKAGYNKKPYQPFQWLGIVLSAITPVVVALSVEEKIRWLTAVKEKPDRNHAGEEETAGT